MTFLQNIMVAEKNDFSANAKHSFAKSKIISRCKDVKMIKLENTFTPPFFNFSDPSHPRGGSELCTYIYI